MSDPEVIVIGAGQAGLAVSHELSGAGIDHVILERDQVGQTWRRRWDSFCLVTPNWTMSLPGLPYDGPDPEGFVPRDEIVGYLERYAESFGAPVRTGVGVHALELDQHGFRLDTSAGDLRARRVVVATGTFARPHRPSLAGSFPPDVLACDADDYTNPGSLPTGRVLVVGSGQTGCQIAEDLCSAGREVCVSCGRASWLPRRVDGRDIVTWANETSFFEAPLSAMPSPMARLAANPQLTGRDGGHDLNYRVLQAMGVTLLGRLVGVDGCTAHFAPDLLESVAFGDARYADFCKTLYDELPARGIRAPELPVPPRFESDPPLEISLDGFGAVIFTAGFRPDFSRWVRIPGAFDDMGFPFAADGASVVAPGLYFVGVHFLRKRKSSLMFGVGEDAAIVAGSISEGAAHV